MDSILDFAFEVLSRFTISIEMRKDCDFSDPYLKDFLKRGSFPQEREIMNISSFFDSKYILFRYQDKYISIGPFLTSYIREEDVDKELLESIGIDIHRLMLIPVVPDSGLFRPMMSSLFDALWGKGKYVIKRFEDKSRTNYMFTPESLEYYNAAEVSRRYKDEAKLLEAVRRCDFDYLKKIFISFNFKYSVEKRNSNPVRNIQNYSIIMNTLLRKTAYDAGVAAIYVDRLSSSFGKKIEMFSTSYAVANFMEEMLTQYAYLIRDYCWSGYPESIRSVLYLIDSRYKERLTLEDLGKAAGLSPSHLSHLFSKTLGKSVIEYLTQVRINKSIDYLKDPDISIAQAAIDSGFEDQAYYTRIFKKVMGMPPTKWREENLRLG